MSWHGKGNFIKGLDLLKRGCFVHVIGRIRTQKYIASDGTERTGIDVIASKVELI